MDSKKYNPCVFCHYARMRKEICGIYCTGGFVKQDGSCEHFADYKEPKQRTEKRRKPKGGKSCPKN